MRCPALLLLLSAASAAVAAPPQRIASLNLCADQYLIALADRSQMVGLTRLARDPAMSAAAAQAQGWPVIGSSAEALLAAAPDLVFTGWEGQGAAARTAGLRARFVTVPPANDYGAIVAQVRLVAGAIGHPERGEALIARMDRALAAIPRSGRGRIAADYQRRGYMSGGGTLSDAMMRRVGLQNLATRIGRPALSNLSLEEMVAARPDYLIVGHAGGAHDLGSAMLEHPALRTIPRLVLAPALTTCGGPSFPQAVRALADQARRAR